LVLADEGALVPVKASFDSQLKEIQNDYNVKNRLWPINYERDLADLQKAFQSQGDLEGWQAVKLEMDRFKQGKIISEADLVDEPSQLKDLQERYISGSDVCELERDRSLVDLYERYQAKLLSMQTELTKAGKMKDALEVNGELKKVESSEELSLARANIEAKGGQEELFAGDEDEDVETSSDESEEDLEPVVEDPDGCVVYYSKKPPSAREMDTRRFQG